MLLKKYGSEESLNQGIEILNNYIQAKQPKYKSHYHVMIGWVYDRMQEKKVKSSSASRKPNIPIVTDQPAYEMSDQEYAELMEMAKELEEVKR